MTDISEEYKIDLEQTFTKPAAQAAEAVKIRRAARRAWMEADLRRIRFYTGGNAGGILATLGIIGSLLAAPDDKGYPDLLFLAVMLFTFGLIGAWLVFNNYPKLVRNDHDEDLAIVRYSRDYPRPHPYADRLHKIGLTVAGTGALIGSGLGLYVLWTFAR